MQVLGIDIGGSGIKGAPVDTKRGDMCQDRLRIPTPQPVTPDAVAEIIADISEHFAWQGKPIGCGFPAVVASGVVKTAANIDKSWIGTNAQQLFADATSSPVQVINDADAAGLAELKFGVMKDRKQVAVLITVGTGLGSVLFCNQILFPNTEFGHLQMNGMLAEHYASDAVRKKQDLSWKKWGKRFNEFLTHLELLLQPDVFVIGGGASKKADRFLEQLTVSAEVVPAQLRNHAGIIGAALAYEYYRT